MIDFKFIISDDDLGCLIFNNFHQINNRLFCYWHCKEYFKILSEDCKSHNLKVNNTQEHVNMIILQSQKVVALLERTMKSVMTFCGFICFQNM